MTGWKSLDAVVGLLIFAVVVAGVGVAMMAQAADQAVPSDSYSDIVAEGSSPMLATFGVLVVAFAGLVAMPAIIAIGVRMGTSGNKGAPAA